MGRQSQRKGAAGEQELSQQLRYAGYPVCWGGNRTYGQVPDLQGLPGIHIECKWVEHLNIAKAMAQAKKDSARFKDGAPTVFHRRDRGEWLVTMTFPDWIRLYGRIYPPVDQHAHARFFIQNTPNFGELKGEVSMNRYWEQETPHLATTAKNELAYYPEAKKLSIAKPSWTDKNGDVRMGKCVVLDLEAAKNCPEATKILQDIVMNFKK